MYVRDTSSVRQFRGTRGGKWNQLERMREPTEKGGRQEGGNGKALGLVAFEGEGSQSKSQDSRLRGDGVEGEERQQWVPEERQATELGAEEEGLEKSRDISSRQQDERQENKKSSIQEGRQGGTSAAQRGELHSQSREAVCAARGGEQGQLGLKPSGKDLEQLSWEPDRELKMERREMDGHSESHAGRAGAC